MRCIFFIICLCLLPKLQGQNFAKVGTKWFYWHTEGPLYENGNDFDESKRSGYYFKSVLDTFIQGKLCQKVEGRYIDFMRRLWFPNQPNKYYSVISPIYFLNENKRVYLYKQGEFRLAYDFNLGEGDSLCVEDYAHPFVRCGMNYIMDTITGVFGNEKRTIYFSKLSEVASFGDPGYFLPVIDGVGGERFIYPISDLLNFHDPYYLWCYYQDSTVYDRGKGYCANWLKFVEEAEAEIAKLAVQEIKFYPNPVTGISKLEFPNPENKTHRVLLYNSLGQIIRDEITDQYFMAFSASELGAGVYQYRLLDENQNELKKDKFVAQ